MRIKSDFAELNIKWKNGSNATYTTQPSKRNWKDGW